MLFAILFEQEIKVRFLLLLMRHLDPIRIKKRHYEIIQIMYYVCVIPPQWGFPTKFFNVFIFRPVTGLTRGGARVTKIKYNLRYVRTVQQIWHVCQDLNFGLFERRRWHQSRGFPTWLVNSCLAGDSLLRDGYTPPKSSRHVISKWKRSGYSDADFACFQTKE
jgi:hypothetical protein